LPGRETIHAREVFVDSLYGTVTIFLVVWSGPILIRFVFEDGGRNVVNWHGSGSEKGDKQENAGKRSPNSLLLSQALPRDQDSSLEHRFRPASQAREGTTGFAEASRARSQGADYHGQTISLNSTTTLDAAIRSRQFLSFAL
jgi:hypothetical protein